MLDLSDKIDFFRLMDKKISFSVFSISVAPSIFTIAIMRGSVSVPRGNDTEKLILGALKPFLFLVEGGGVRLLVCYSCGHT